MWDWVSDVLVPYVGDVDNILLRSKIIVSFFSGGRDSLVATHLAYDRLSRLGIHDRFRVCFIDTTTALPDTIEYVRDVCRENGWKLDIIRPDETYEELVMKWGFPCFNYRWCMKNLKIKPIKKYMGRMPHPRVEVLGLRRHESRQRLLIYEKISELTYSKKDNAFVWLPIIDWLDDQVTEYIRRHGLRINPVYKKLGFPGDCLCMACGNPRREIPRLRAYYPEQYRWLLELYRRVNRERWRKEKITLKGRYDLDEEDRQSLLTDFL